MFHLSDNSNPDFELDVSHFDTSKVTDMSYMFADTGRKNTNFILDVSNFDTSNVTDMSDMFYCTGYQSTLLNIDVSNFDMSKVTAADYMFYQAGNRSNQFVTTLTISNPNMSSYTKIFFGAANNTGSKITLNFTIETEDLVNKIISSTIGKKPTKGKLIVDVDNLDVGDEIHISGEKFNVISQTDDTVTMLAKYNLGTDYKQSITQNNVTFSENIGWEYTPGPKEIDIQLWSTNPKNYVNAYVTYLKEETAVENLYGDLITLSELKALECLIPENYGSGTSKSCADSSYVDWLVNGQSWWTHSANADSPDIIWNVGATGYLSQHGNIFSHGVRPTITISKEALKNYLKK
jgi:surface protein